MFPNSASLISMLKTDTEKTSDELQTNIKELHDELSRAGYTILRDRLNARINKLASIIDARDSDYAAAEDAGFETPY